MKLPEGLICGDSNRCCQVQGTQWLLVEAGKGDPVRVSDLLMEPVRAAMPLISEKEGIPLLKFNFPECLFRVSGEQPDPVREIRRGLECLP